MIDDTSVVVSVADLEEVEQHFLLAFAEVKPIPKTPDEIIEKLRHYFDDQKVDAISRVLVAIGEENFRKLIMRIGLRGGYIPAEIYSQNGG